MASPAPWREPARRLLSTTGETGSSIGLGLVRIYVGAAILAAHALPKLAEMRAGEGRFTELVAEMGFPAPTLFAWMATLAQVAGAALMIAGVATRVAALMILSTLGVGIIGVHWGDPFPLVEAGVAYLVVLAALLVAGGGRFSIDARLLRGSA